METKTGLEKVFEMKDEENAEMNYQQLLEHEKDLYFTVEEIFDRHFMNAAEYNEALEEFKKHLKVYEPD